MVNKKSPQLIGEVVRHLRGGQHAPPALTNAQRKLFESSSLILGEAADAKDAAYLARELVQASLPHSNPGDIGVALIFVPKVPVLSLAKSSA